MTEPTDDEIATLYTEQTGFALDDSPAALLDFARAVLAKWGTPQQEAQEPCQTCIALDRTVMLDQVSFDRKPDGYGIRQITDDEGVEEWEDIRTSPDVAREEANDMMATGRGEIYEVVPLWTTPQPTQAQAGAVPLYRLLQSGVDRIEAADEFLSDDTTAWAIDPNGIFVGSIYGGHVLRPARRCIKGGQHGL